jgi:hypothetical protein
MRVVAAVDLVRGEVHEDGRGKRQVDVDRDLRAQAAQVLGVLEPVLSRDELELETLTVREPDAAPGEPPQLGRDIQERPSRSSRGIAVSSSHPA